MKLPLCESQRLTFSPFPSQNKVSKTLDGFDQIAYGAKILFDLCDPNWKHASFSGQQFYDDGWNVIVRGGNC